MQELAALLRSETQTIHQQVESGVFMTTLLKGQLERSAYVLFLRNLVPIYDELEQGLERHADAPGISPILIRPLFRSPALHRDLELLHGASWRNDLLPVTACLEYVSHLRSLQNTAPARLAAHAYVRYLGDLSGGQMLGKIVARGLKLVDSFPDIVGSGVDFYHFGQADEVVGLAQRFRTGLDEIGKTGTRELLDEAVTAFELHIRLFHELAARCGLLPAENSYAPIKCPGTLG